MVGGGGFIGQHVLAELAEADLSLAALDVYEPKNLEFKVDWIVGTANDEALLSSAVNGCDIVIFLASSSLPASANADVASEVTSHVRMVVKAAEICSHQAVERFIFSSSGGTVYGTVNKDLITEDERTQPLNAYGASKVSIEQYLRIVSSFRGMKTISLRISNPFGPGQRASRGQGFVAAAMSAAIDGNVLQCWGDGSTVRDFIYVRDVAAAFVRCCEYEGDSTIFNIGSGIGRSLRDIITAIEATAGCSLSVSYAPSRKIDVPRNVLDISLASKELSWRPSMQFCDGLRLTAAWWRKTNTKGLQV